MKKQVLFIHGGAGVEDYAVDAPLVDSLKKVLGDAFEVHYPVMINESTPDYGRKKQIAKEISAIGGDVILAGHSLGASMILKFLSESKVEKKITGLFLIATPFWHGDEEWKDGLKLRDDFAERIPQNLPIFLYHSIDDEEVPIEHLDFYVRNLPQATVRRIANGGHQLNSDLSQVAKDMMSL